MRVAGLELCSSAMRETLFLLTLASAAFLGCQHTRSSIAPAQGQRSDETIALRITGTRTEGNVPSSFETVIDLRSGFSRMVQQRGPERVFSGFDGEPWVAGNGIVTVVDLPALVADARAHAFVDRAAWRTLSFTPQAPVIAGDPAAGGAVRYRPSEASDVEVIVDPKTHLTQQVTIETDDGPLITRYDDWRRVGPLLYPFHQVETDNTGETTILQAASVIALQSVDPAAFVRPPASPHGRLNVGKSATVPIQLIGSTQSHIVTPAKIDGVDAHLMFDTGAANYVTTDAAPQFHLTTFGGLNLSGVGSSSTTGGFARVGSISLDSAELRDETVIVGPSPFPAQNGHPAAADGFTGYEFLSEFRTTLDYAGKSITFTRFDDPFAATGTTVPFYSDGHSIYVSASVEGRPGLFRLDTGDGHVITIFPDYAKRNDLHPTESEARTGGGGLGGAVRAKKGKLSSFSFAGLHFADLPVDFSQNETGAFASRSLAGNMGAGILQCYRITFDYRARNITFDPKPDTPNCGRGATVTRE